MTEDKSSLALFPSGVRVANNFKDRTSERFNLLTVISRAPNRIRVNGKVRVRWNCKCDCGKFTTVDVESLVKGSTKACGCQESAITHGHARIGRISPEFRVYCGMLQRCINPNAVGFKNYGGRGISVCERWRESFTNFLSDMGHRPSRLQIERKDNNGNYEPSNCVWATRKEQAQNRRTTVFLTIGYRREKISKWSEESGIASKVILFRLKSGWEPKRAVFSPIPKRFIRPSNSDLRAGPKLTKS